MNPLDVAIVNEQFPLRRLQPSYIAGYEAVVQLGDGTRCYLTGPPAPYGALAELVPVPIRPASRFRSALTPGSPPAARRVAGVRNVHNHLQVVLPDEDYRDDATLTTAANDALTLNVTVPDGVEAAARDGNLALTGPVEYGRTRRGGQCRVDGRRRHAGP